MRSHASRAADPAAASAEVARTPDAGAIRDSLHLVQPILVITNAEAGSTDKESLERALAVLRSATDVEVDRDGRPR